MDNTLKLLEWLLDNTKSFELDKEIADALEKEIADEIITEYYTDRQRWTG